MIIRAETCQGCSRRPLVIIFRRKGQRIRYATLCPHKKCQLSFAGWLNRYLRQWHALDA